MRVAYRGQKIFLKDQLGGSCRVGNHGVWTRLVAAEVESNVDGVGGSEAIHSPLTGICSNCSSRFVTFSRKGQIVNILGFAGVQERVTTVSMMLLPKRACWQEWLLTGVWELG